MKVLYVTNYHQIAVNNRGYISDYLNDLLFYGLYEILGTNLVDSTPIISLYESNLSTIDTNMLWGGFSSFWLINKDLVDRTDIKEKIKNKYFDLIIYGAIKRCQDYYELVSSIYPKNKIIIVDGSDEQALCEKFLVHPYFKRELVEERDNLFPISFAIPSSKLTSVTTEQIKNKAFGNVFPGIEHTYTFEREEAFYQDYQSSFYGLTMKKDGWDCMRHYEILGNYCMPYFIGLANCPSLTMVNLPKKLITQSMKLFNSPTFNLNLYYELLEETFEHTKSKLTTKSIAAMLLEKVI